MCCSSCCLCIIVHWCSFFCHICFYAVESATFHTPNPPKTLIVHWWSFFIWWDLLVFILFNVPHFTHPTHQRQAKPYLFLHSFLLKSNLLLQSSPQLLLRAAVNTPSSAIPCPSLQEKPSWQLLSPQLPAAMSMLSLWGTLWFSKLIIFFFVLILINFPFFKWKFLLEVAFVSVFVFEKSDLIRVPILFNLKQKEPTI